MNCCSRRPDTLYQKKLCLIGLRLPSFTPESLPSALRAFPAITTLVVCDARETLAAFELNRPPPGFQLATATQLLELLTPGATEPEPLACPLLQELVLHGPRDLNKSDVDNFIEGRMELGQGFRRLHIVVQQAKDLGLVSQAEIEVYLARGIHVSIVALKEMRWQ
ncbi:hypothetical protein C8R46DRAFT_346482 [Mycena filopes]|nr:hypothetical protein C8R46DRAFT_346482 [Mycena filopes]